MLEPSIGLLTFRAEGNDLKSSRDYSKKIHWPGSAVFCGKNNSGVTIGRGFDLGDRTRSEVFISLQKAGIEKEKAEILSYAAKLKGCLAHKFVLENRETLGEITDRQQLILFTIAYEEMKKDVERICKDKKVIIEYHSNPNISPRLAWDNIPEKIKEILIDLRYRGDYNVSTRSHLQRLAYDGDLESFGKMLSDRSLWLFVPKDRFKRRVDFYENY
ncbi:hypothetical protein L2C91_09640 [Rosenbergiella epipactidis]|uniref:hypothetical protein n=1 Tax=Rosenbergiella epipactidis TaxID=1544694 RepID=UPI00202601E9|nr:hypothetical protein [Rosenbergiella epipactidis]MCL9668630.1 hypothetical protein [Rosenbergiella epipactidis]